MKLDAYALVEVGLISAAVLGLHRSSLQAALNVCLRASCHRSVCLSTHLSPGEGRDTDTFPGALVGTL